MVGTLQGGAVVPTAPTELLGYCLVGALQGGAVVPTAPTELWGYCLVGALETSAPPESTLGYFTSSFFTLPLAVRTMLIPRCRHCIRTPPRV